MKHNQHWGGGYPSSQRAAVEIFPKRTEKQQLAWSPTDSDEVESNHFKRCGSVVKNPPAKKETWVQPLGQEEPLEKERGTHSSILPWEI